MEIQLLTRQSQYRHSPHQYQHDQFQLHRECAPRDLKWEQKWFHSKLLQEKKKNRIQ